jgi:hypothetical protein
MKTIVTIGLGAALTSTAVAGTASFELWENTLGAADMTPDGSIVVGDVPGGIYIWRAGEGFSLFGADGSATAISDDGTLVFGNLFATQEAAIWNAVDGWLGLGGLGSECGSTSSGYELSGDGAVGVGLGWNNCSGRGFRWTEAEGMLELQNLGNGNNRSSVVSADGSVMAGFAQGAFSRTPAVWYADLSGRLLDEPNGEVVGEVQGMSDDGTILLGNWNGQAFMWTEKDGVTLLGELFPGWVAAATDIADDGTIVGHASLVQSFEAWIKLPGEDITSLEDYLTDQGAEGVPHLDFAQAISTDATTIIGQTSRFPSIGWIAHLPGAERCAGDVDGDNVVDFDDLLLLLASWGPCPGCDADFDGNDMVDFADLLTLLSAWGPCP